MFLYALFKDTICKMQFGNTRLVVILLVFCSWSDALLELGCRENSTVHTFRTVMCEGHNVTQFPRTFPKDIRGLYIHDGTLFILKSQTRDYGSLVELSVQRSMVTTIEVGFFDKMYHLERLSLNDNILSSVPPLHHLKKLKYLNLNRNRLTTLGSALIGLTSLLEFTAEANMLKNVEGNVFEGLAQIQLINLQNNLLDFANVSFLANLKILKLDNNKITTLSGCLDGLVSLLELEAASNSIYTISSDSFVTLGALKHLYLGSNHISSILPGTFRHNHNLSSLHLSHNPLSSVDNILPSDHEQFQILNLTNANLRFFPSFLPISTQFIDVSNNHISSIRKSDVSHYANLHALVLDGNKIESVDYGAFSELTALSHLLLINCSLKSFPEPLPPGIKLAQLDYNEIETIPVDAFMNGTELHLLSFRGNNLRTIPQTLFHNLAKLDQLHMDNNPIEILEDNTFRMISGLKYLSLARLGLTAIYPDCFVGLDELKNLDLSFVDVPLETIYGNIFMHFETVETLHLQESINITAHLISTLTENTEQGYVLPKLSHLNLDYNNIGTVDVILDVTSVLPNLQTLSVRGNDLECNTGYSSNANLSDNHALVVRGFTCSGKQYPDMSLSHLFATVRNMDTSYGDYAHYYVDPDHAYYTDDGSDYFDYVYENTPEIEDNDIPFFTGQFTSEYDSITTTMHSFYNTYQTESPTTTVSESPTSTVSESPTTTVSESPLETNRPILNTSTLSMQTKRTPQVKAIERNVTRPKSKSGHFSKWKSAGIAIGTSVAVVLVMILITVVVLKLCFNRRYPQPNAPIDDANGQSYVFIASTERQPEAKVHRKLSRKERGSTTSRASEDITNKSDTTMKVYTLDVDA